MSEPGNESTDGQQPTQPPIAQQPPLPPAPPVEIAAPEAEQPPVVPGVLTPPVPPLPPVPAAEFPQTEFPQAVPSQGATQAPLAPQAPQAPQPPMPPEISVEGIHVAQPPQAPQFSVPQPPQFSQPQPQGTPVPATEATPQAMPQAYEYAQQPQQPPVANYPAPGGYSVPEAPAYVTQQQAMQQPGMQQPGQQWVPGMPPGGMPPGGQPPHKSGGLSTGAWIGIGAGALVLIAGIVLAIVFFIIIPGQSDSASDAEASTSTTKSETSSPTPTKEVDEDDDDDVVKGGTGVLLMTDVANFGVGPYWSVIFDDWEIDVFDVNGENFFSHPASGCQFYSYQGLGGIASSTDSDQAASEKTLESAVKTGLGLPWDFTGSPNIAWDATVPVSAYGYTEVEMLRYVADYQASDGTDRTRVFLIRNFQPSDAALFAMTDCPVSTADVGSNMMNDLWVNDLY